MTRPDDLYVGSTRRDGTYCFSPRGGTVNVCFTTRRKGFGFFDATRQYLPGICQAGDVLQVGEVLRDLPTPAIRTTIAVPAPAAGLLSVLVVWCWSLTELVAMCAT